MMACAMKPIAAAMLAFGLAATPAVAQETGSRQTREFVQAAVDSDTFEIMEAYTALAQSSDPKVTDFARQMIHDHSETSRKVREAATSAGLKPPPMAVGASQSPFLAALQSAQGREFDKIYWHQQALAHRSALTTIQEYAETGDNPPLREIASATVPIIRRHLAMAEQMAKTLENGS
jgi:putative membrane protein